MTQARKKKRVGTPRAAKGMIGFKSGKLTVIAREGVRYDRAATWVCECLCGNRTVATTSDLRRGKRKSCGCARHDFIPKLEPVVGVDPAVKFVFRQMNKQLATQQDVARRAGVTSHIMYRWRSGEVDPSITRLRAVLGALGYRIRIEEDDE